MAISLIGTEKNDGYYNNNSEITITVPANTVTVVIAILFYQSGTIFAPTIDGQSFSMAFHLNSDTNYNMMCMGHRHFSSTGSKIIVVGTSAAGTSATIYTAYFSGVDTESGLRDSDCIASSTPSLTLTTNVGDYVLAAAYVDAAITWTPSGIEIREDGYYYGLAGLIADAATETISCTNLNTGLGAIVLPSVAAAAAAIPPHILRSRSDHILAR